MESCSQCIPHHAEGLVDPKVLAKKPEMILDSPDRACRFRKHQIENRLPIPLPSFFKT
jgi:hypothetical protein